MKNKIHQKFKPLFWWCKLSGINPEEHQRLIIVQTINYGDWWHWLWIIRYYGKKELKNIIRDIPMSEFRPRALNLICLLLGIKKLKYASRSDYIKTKKNF